MGSKWSLHSPVERDADEDVAREEEAEDLEEGEDPAEDVARPPHHRRRPTDLQRHHQESHLKRQQIIVTSDVFSKVELLSWKIVTLYT